VIRLELVDQDPVVVRALSAAFACFPEVSVLEGDLLDAARHSAVSPANSYGFMDGGIDQRFQAFFGPQLERDVRDAILRRPEGHLPVGASLVIATRHARIPYLIVAPTMLMPEHVAAQNAYRALRAVLRLATTAPIEGGPIFCPGMTTGVGGVAPEEAAAAMATAYADWTAAQLLVCD
jgi:O-acetyl-ADP-ribose deacetylase (regulator of RNase III)